MKDVLQTNKKYAIMRVLYIFEAAFEYFFTLAVGSVYLAKLTAYMGISDKVTGILTAFVSLGCGFQMLAIFMAKRRNKKRLILFGSLLNQFLFIFLYFIPILRMSRMTKTALFIVMLLVAHIIRNAITSPKINWYMSFVPLKKRGRFTAKKEIVSLVSGMLVTYALGSLMDHYEAIGDMRTAFIICGCCLTALMFLYSGILLATEKPQEDIEQQKFSVKGLFCEKDLIKIVLLFTLWNIASCATTSFMGTYQTKELGFSTTFASIIIAITSLIRAIFSQPMGKLADKRSFRNMLIVCFAIELLAFGVSIFTAPSNGKVLYPIYSGLYCLGMAGINSGMLNLMYDYVKVENRTGAYALIQTVSGIAGFLITLLFSPLVEYIQKNGNQIFGLPLYAQQVLSIFSFLVVAVILLYMYFGFKNSKKNTETENVIAERTDGESSQNVS